MHEPFGENGSELKGEEELLDAVTVHSRGVRGLNFDLCWLTWHHTTPTPLSCLSEEAHSSLPISAHAVFTVEFRGITPR